MTKQTFSCRRECSITPVNFTGPSNVARLRAMSNMSISSAHAERKGERCRYGLLAIRGSARFNALVNFYERLILTPAQREGIIKSDPARVN